MEMSILTCGRCDKNKPVTEFYENPASARGFHSYCKECFIAYTTDRLRRRKIQAVEYLGGKCAKCKGDFHPTVFDFHHKNPEEKEHAGVAIRQLSWENAKAELDKCELLCSNCHRLHHWGHISLDSEFDSILTCRILPKRKNPPFSKEELERLVWEKPLQDIAADYNVSTVFLRNVRSDFGIQKPPRGHWIKNKRRVVERPTKEQLEVELLNASFVKVGAEYGVTGNSVRKWCWSYGLDPKELIVRRRLIKNVGDRYPQ